MTKSRSEYYQRNKEAIKEKNKEWKESNKDKVKQNMKEWRLKNPDRRQYFNIKNRAKLKGIEFTLDIEDIVYPEYCPILNIKLERGKGSGGKPNSPSVDRIDPAKGYVKGNIQVISQLANVMKNNATPEQLLAFATWVMQTYMEKE